MKTNHQRGFVEKATAYVGPGANGGGYDACCGKHGIARQNRGRKKFFNSRARFKVHSLERQLLKEQNPEYDGVPFEVEPSVPWMVGKPFKETEEQRKPVVIEEDYDMTH